MAQPRDEASARVGVLLVNLGTPDAPTASAVRRYLREFLSDPRVVALPRIVWLPILYLLILPFRPVRAAHKYATIWREDSPLRLHLARQVQLLRGFLGERTRKAIPVAGGMRYGNPPITQALEELKARGCDRIVVFPLYPQYATSTTASAEDALGRALRGWKPAPRVKVIGEFHAHPLYVKAIARNVNEYWMKSGRPDRLVMSFHGLPKVVAAREPYEAQCRESARLIAIELGWNDARTLVTFQSRLGRAEWLTPYTADTLASLGRDGIGRVDVVCPGFAADCLETLEEIAQEGRRLFLEAGGKEFHYIPTTNDTPAWMTALTAIVAEHL